MSKELFDLMARANALTPDDQLRLISYLVERVRRCNITPKPRRNLTELEGIAPNLLGGMDAQEYVNRIKSGESLEIEISEMESRKEK